MRAFSAGRKGEEGHEGKMAGASETHKKRAVDRLSSSGRAASGDFLPVEKKEQEGKTEEEAGEQIPEEGYEPYRSQTEELEEKLERALSRVEGVGKVEVVLSLESTNQKVVEKDVPASRSSQESSGAQESSSASSVTTEESTVYQTDSDGSETPYVVRENYPEIRGVLVVAQGGGDPVAVQQIQEAVMALFRVEAHKIKVMKMKGS